MPVVGTAHGHVAMGGHKNGDEWRHPRTAVGAAVRWLEPVLKLYQGPFLKDAEGGWVLAPRKRLRSEFLRGIARLGEWHESRGAWETALELPPGLEVDPLAEELCRHAMFCCQRLNRCAEAIVLYERFRHILTAQLGIEPSEKLRQFAERLQGTMPCPTEAVPPGGAL